MDYGMPTLLSHKTLCESVRECESLGLDFIEINMNMPAYAGDNITKEMLSPRGGVYFTLHLDECFNPCDFNSTVAEAYAKSALRAISLAADAGAPAVNMHLPLGVRFLMPDGHVNLFDEYFNIFSDGLRSFRDAAEKAANGMAKICVENTSFTRLERTREAFDILLESDAFSLTYDAGHDACDGFAAREYYESRAKRITHMHLHQSDGETCHLPLGAGVSNVDGLTEAVQRTLIEIKDVPGLRKSVDWLRGEGRLR